MNSAISPVQEDIYKRAGRLHEAKAAK